MAKQITRLDRGTVSRRWLIRLLRRQRDGYMGVAFPKGGAKTIRTRDQQNRALVARGGMFAMDSLIEHFGGRSK